MTTCRAASISFKTVFTVHSTYVSLSYVQTSLSLSLTNTEYNNVVTIIGRKNGKQIKVRQKMMAYFSWFMPITSCESFICESFVETIDSTAVVSQWWAKHP